MTYTTHQRRIWELRGNHANHTVIWFDGERFGIDSMLDVSDLDRQDIRFDELRAVRNLITKALDEAGSPGDPRLTADKTINGLARDLADDAAEILDEVMAERQAIEDEISEAHRNALESPHGTERPKWRPATADDVGAEPGTYALTDTGSPTDQFLDKRVRQTAEPLFLDPDGLWSNGRWGLGWSYAYILTNPPVPA